MHFVLVSDVAKCWRLFILIERARFTFRYAAVSEHYIVLRCTLRGWGGSRGSNQNVNLSRYALRAAQCGPIFVADTARQLNSATLLRGESTNYRA